MLSFRRQLPVASPLPAGALLRAAADAAARSDRSSEVEMHLAEEFDATAVVLTDSGTSALVLALSIAAGKGETVALPAYACANVVAAARRADVRVRLYDVDPNTLGPDLDSLRKVLSEGVKAVVVAHLYGYPADVPAVRKLAEENGVQVIEDAAQHAGATLHGVRAGSMSDVAILSFGRGKGTTSGNGGALLGFGEDASKAVAARKPGLVLPDNGVSDFVAAAATWAIGRPDLYLLPSSLPWLHLGETVYHKAKEPRAMSRVATSILSRTLNLAAEAVAVRRYNAFALHAVAATSRHVRAIVPIEGAMPGYLRFPVLFRGDPHEEKALGITRGYPRALSFEPELQPILCGQTVPLHGSVELAARLVTLPTHGMVTDADLQHLSKWLHSV